MARRKISREQFIQGITNWFQASGYRVGSDTSGLPAHGDETVVHLVSHLVAHAVGLHAGPTGTKQVTAEEAAKALAGIVDASDVLGWRLGGKSVLIPVFCLDDSTPDETQELLAACVEVGKRVLIPLSQIKYGGYICIFPLLVYFDEERYLQNLIVLKVEDSYKSWGQKVEMVAGLVNVRRQEVHWPEKAFSNRMEDYAQSITKRPEIFGTADLRTLSLSS
jgi:hypothetical protein